MTLAAAGALAPDAAIELVDTMGALMEREGVGGQLIYPVSDADWRPSAERAAVVEKALAVVNAKAGAEAFLSIDLGGMAVLAGNEAGLEALEAELPPVDDRFPFRLARHAAFHTPLLAHVSEAALGVLGRGLFQRPELPMIDGRGQIWRPYQDLTDLRAYTLGAQITTTYNFSKAVEVAVKEFCPDRLIVLGPGSTLGPPVAQELIKHRWQGLASKADFAARQAEDPFVLAMGIEDQRARVVG